MLRKLALAILTLAVLGSLMPTNAEAHGQSHIQNQGFETFYIANPNEQFISAQVIRVSDCSASSTSYNCSYGRECVAVRASFFYTLEVNFAIKENDKLVKQKNGSLVYGKKFITINVDRPSLTGAPNSSSDLVNQEFIAKNDKYYDYKAREEVLSRCESYRQGVQENMYAWSQTDSASAPPQKQMR